MASKERVRAVEVPGPVGRLEGLLHIDEASPPTGLAVVCHPHPVYGGTMHNKVVHRIDRALFQQGRAVLRFNFRGVGMSAGEFGDGYGEREDAKAALRFMTQEFAELPVMMAGFSFGTDKALYAGLGHPRVEGFVLLGTSSVAVSDRPAQAMPPSLVIHGGDDDTTPIGPVRNWAQDLPAHSKFVVVEGADHFFADYLDQVEALILQM